MAAVVLVMLGALAVADAASPAIDTVDLAKAQFMAQAGATVIDVRRVDEWRSTGVVPGSLLITAFGADGRFVPGFVEAVRAQVPAGKPVVLICRTGNRSGLAAKVLADQGGYQDLHNAAGGITEWARSGRPLVPCSSC
jgi:rhodanese-related sulfurtransferase